MARSSGVLMHLSSLPSPHGIGTMGKSAVEFIDFLKEAGQSYWQMLPIHPTGFGDSPYQPSSTFAGNPYFIDLDTLVQHNLLTPQQVAGFSWGDQENRVDFEKILQNRQSVLRLAYQSAGMRGKIWAREFEKSHPWASDFALFTAIKQRYGGKPWTQWENGLKLRQPQAMAQARKELKDEIAFVLFLQHLFFSQWRQLKEHAAKQGVKLIGDIPIYVSMDSADVWSNPQMFALDQTLTPTAVAGCPPDYFSPTGQLWGNPLYNWDYMKKTNYSWWGDRLSALCTLFDVVRIDHFRGFASYYAIPYGDKTAEHGVWLPGPKQDLFDTLSSTLGTLPLIAEDLGLQSPDVTDLMEHCGYPGMKVLSFAFDSDAKNPYLPHNHSQNCVSYTGTHDNDTFIGWWDSASDYPKRHFTDYLGCGAIDSNTACQRAVALNMASVADLAIAPMQDFLQLGTSARMNTPSTIGGENWRWRVNTHQLNQQLAQQMMHLSRLYGRIE